MELCARDIVRAGVLPCFRAGEVVVERVIGGGGLNARVLSGGEDWYGAKFMVVVVSKTCSRGQFWSRGRVMNFALKAWGLGLLIWTG